MRLRTLVAATASAVALLLSACSSPGSQSSSTDPQRGGDLTVVISGQTWAHLDVAAPAVTPIKSLLNNIYEPLLRYSPDGKIEPWLATSYDVSQDRLTWTFHLRPNVKFQDGTPFDSAAVKFNFMRQVDPALKAGEGANLPKDIAVETPDPLTAVVKLTQPDESLDWAIATTAVGLMASPTAVQKWGNEYGLHPVGTGPFKLDSQVVGQEAHLVRWEGYWRRGEPYLNSVTFRTLGSAQSALQTVQSGGAQIMDFVPPLQAKAVAGAGSSNLKLIEGKATAVNEIMFNTTAAPFSDLRARRAVGYAINQDELSKNLFFGFDKPVESIMASGSWAYPGPKVPDYPSFDLGKAKELVGELGGLTFSLKTSNSSDFLQQAAALQAQLARAGITMNIEPVEPTKKIADAFQRNYQATQFIVPGLPDPDNYARPFFDPSAGANPSGLNDPQLNQLFTQGHTTAGQQQRKAIYDQMAKRMAELAPVVFLSDAPPLRIQGNTVHGVGYLPTNAFYLNSAWLSH